MTNVDLLLIPAPADAFSASEIAAIDELLQNGGSLFLMGEPALGILGEPPPPPTNTFANNLLSGLGIGMNISNNILDIGPQVATGVQIATHPLTNGVASFNYGATSSVVGGTPLFFANNGDAFIAVVDSVSDAVIPEPITATLGLMGLGVLGMATRRRAA